MPPELEELYHLLGEMLEKGLGQESRLKEFSFFQLGTIEGFVDLIVNKKSEDSNEFVYPFGIRQRAWQVLILKIGQQLAKLVKVPDLSRLTDFSRLKEEAGKILVSMVNS